MLVTRTTDPECREQLAELHRLIVRAHAITKDLMSSKVDGLEWVDNSLLDAGRDVAGIFNASEPLSFRQ
ncbi:hypothetical protein [Azospirillum himalayense]|uniref:Uncharacterized protein n=1 Tax=Azospirillum himalayense TaxID=654847 RepID=A0ABW0FYW2_9PROT